MRRENALDTMLLALAAFLTNTRKTKEKVMNKIHNNIYTQRAGQQCANGMYNNVKTERKIVPCYA